MVSGITNSDNLPRVDVTINDFGLRIAPAAPGPKVTIIGSLKHTGGTLPVNEPLLIDNISVAMRNLRNDVDSSPSDLSLAVEEAIGAGATNVEIVITDTGQKTPFTGTEADLATYATSQYTKLETTYDKLLNHEVDVVFVAGVYADGFASAKGIDGVIQTGVTDHAASQNFTKQLADFCFQQTKETNSAFGVIGTTPITTVAKNLRWRENGSQAVTQYTGADGAFFNTPSITIVDEYVKYLTQETGDSTVFNACTGEAGASDVTGGYTGLAANLYAKWNTYLHGSVQGSDPPLPHSTYIDEFQALDTEDNLAVDTDGNKVDAGAYVSVVAGVSRAFGTEATRFANKMNAANTTYVNSNGAAAFAGALSVSAPHMGLTNRSLQSVGQVRAISSRQSRDLLRHRMVSLVQKAAGYVVASGITGAFNAGASSRSDFVRITTIRTVQAMAEVIRDAGESFIGKPISGPFLAALESAIDTDLQRALKRGAIRSYDFAITSTPDQQVLGEVSIDLSMVPAFELLTINTTVSLSKGEGLG